MTTPCLLCASENYQFSKKWAFIILRHEHSKKQHQLQLGLASVWNVLKALVLNLSYHNQQMREHRSRTYPTVLCLPQQWEYWHRYRACATDYTSSPVFLQLPDTRAFRLIIVQPHTGGIPAPLTRSPELRCIVGDDTSLAHAYPATQK